MTLTARRHAPALFAAWALLVLVYAGGCTGGGEPTPSDSESASEPTRSAERAGDPATATAPTPDSATDPPAAAEPPPRPTPGATSKAPPTEAPPPAGDRKVQDLGGGVRFYPEEKVVEVDGYLNLRQGFLEFIACAPGVKPHETLVSLECDPIQLNVGLLLLGVEPGTPPESDFDLAPIAGDRLLIELRWQEPGEGESPKTVRRRLEDCILNGSAEETMLHSGWVYLGSRFLEIDPRELGEEVPEGEEPQMKSMYAPVLTGQYVAISHRPLALIDNPLGLHFVDGDYYVYSDVLPPFDRDEPPLVTMIFRRPRPGEIDEEARFARPPKGRPEPLPFEKDLLDPPKEREQ